MNGIQIADNKRNQVREGGMARTQRNKRYCNADNIIWQVIQRTLLNFVNQKKEQLSSWTHHEHVILYFSDSLQAATNWFQRESITLIIDNFLSHTNTLLHLYQIGGKRDRMDDLGAVL